MRLVWVVLSLVIPSSLKRRLGTRLFGWDIHPTAHIGRSVVLVRRLTMGPGATIGPFNVIKDVDELRMGEGASIGSRNWIIGFPLESPAFRHSPDRDPSLVMGRFSVLSVAHNVDCADRVEICDFASVAGYHTSVLTHSLDLVRDRFVTSPVVIGERSAVMSNCALLNGARVPPRSVVSAGSVVNTRLTQELTFYRGNPAEAVRALPARLKFFTREGHVGTG